MEKHDENRMNFFLFLFCYLHKYGGWDDDDDLYQSSFISGYSNKND